MKKLALLALTFSAPAVLLASSACKINGKSYGPGSGSSGGGGSNNPAESGGGGGGGEPQSDGSRGCSGEPLERAKRNGMTGPCWDPPGDYDTVSPVHIVPGKRQMERTTDGDDVYWFDMPKEATATSGGACAVIPTGDAYVADVIAYEPYADEDPLTSKPEIPDMLGESMEKVFAYLDGLDKPFCVTVRWDESCQREPGTLCDDERAPDESGHLRLTFAGKRPR